MFDFDDDGKSYVKKQPSNDKEIEATQESIDACCVAAIKWED
ncbi:MAG: ferredoxin [Patescibacteria group bacterium]